MIGSLRGVVLERSQSGTVLIEVAGVGYVCSVTPSTLAELEPTVQTYLYIHHHVREDAQTLYAFATRDERDIFETLIATHGIGPSMALAILSVYSPRALVDIIATSDATSLTLVSGVGKKTAERILIELKDRLSLNNLSTPMLNGEQSSSSVGNVREALAGLGYAQDEIRDVLRNLDGSLPAELLLRESLAMLGASRA
ncbi:MAG: Holliday junction branch migration protein RuvA [Ilumatobacteraceae bacterium]|nr:Holliday junction branch migration protein RuvA [Ilumatobacteraceae bacterium]